MSREVPATLVEEDISILLALWNDLYQAQDASKRRNNGLTRDQLAVLLVGEDKTFRTKHALDKHLGGLKLLTNTVQTERIEAKGSSGKKTGKRRDSYSLAEGKVVSWPSTARIIMEVWNHGGHHIPEPVLIKHVEELGLRREEEVPKLTREEIIRDIEFCIGCGYFDRHGNDLRSYLPRTRLELDYITAIAAHCLTDSAAAEPSSPANNAADPGGT